MLYSICTRRLCCLTTISIRPISTTQLFQCSKKKKPKPKQQHDDTPQQYLQKIPLRTVQLGGKSKKSSNFTVRTNFFGTRKLLKFSVFCIFKNQDWKRVVIPKVGLINLFLQRIMHGKTFAAGINWSYRQWEDFDWPFDQFFPSRSVFLAQK